MYERVVCNEQTEQSAHQPGGPHCTSSPTTCLCTNTSIYEIYTLVHTCWPCDSPSVRKATRGRGLDDGAPEILSAPQDDSQGLCHTERSEGCLLDFWGITRCSHYAVHELRVTQQ